MEVLPRESIGIYYGELLIRKFLNSQDNEMFKKIPGNHDYIISLDGEIRNTDGTECTLPIINGSIVLQMYGEWRAVDVTWLSLIAHFEVELPEKLRSKLWSIDFTDANPFLPIKSGKIMLFRTPIIVFKKYRIIPGFTNYAVSSSGEFIEMATGRILEHRIRDRNSPYISVRVYDPSVQITRRMVIHRLIALAWIPNKDFKEKYLINHKDGDKTNFSLRNLEWSNHVGNCNHAVEIGLRNDNEPCKVLDILTREIKTFPSLSKAFTAMGRDRVITSYLAKVNKVRLLDDRYEIKYLDDESPWVYADIDKPLPTGKYEIKVTYPDNSVRMFYNLEEFIKVMKAFNLPGRSVTHAVAKALKRNPGVKIEVVNQYDIGPVQAYDVSNREIISAATINELSKKLDIEIPTLRRRISKGENFVFNGFAFRKHSNEPWNTNFTDVVKSKCISAYNEHLDKELIFDSIRKTSVYFKVHKPMIVNRLKNGKPLDGWYFKEIKNDSQRPA
jgi:hypothetical protein